VIDSMRRGLRALRRCSFRVKGAPSSRGIAD
jgi:hypothetical protein